MSAVVLPPSSCPWPRTLQAHIPISGWCHSGRCPSGSHTFFLTKNKRPDQISSGYPNNAAGLECIHQQARKPGVKTSDDKLQTVFGRGSYCTALHCQCPSGRASTCGLDPLMSKSPGINQPVPFHGGVCQDHPKDLQNAPAGLMQLRGAARHLWFL